MSALIGFIKNILELIGVLFKFIFINIEDIIGIHIMNKSENKKLNKKMVYSSTVREDKEKEAKVMQSKRVQASKFDTGLEDEYLYTVGTGWSKVEDYEEPIGI
jgi:hypothetical protein